jgi:hypothetical protein
MMNVQSFPFDCKLIGWDHSEPNAPVEATPLASISKKFCAQQLFHDSSLTVSAVPTLPNDWLMCHRSANAGGSSFGAVGAVATTGLLGTASPTK